MDRWGSDQVGRIEMGYVIIEIRLGMAWNGEVMK